MSHPVGSVEMNPALNNASVDNSKLISAEYTLDNNDRL